MKTTKVSLQDKKIIVENKMTAQETKKQNQLAARKRIEDYLAEKQLRKNISDFDYGF
jgi:hypothetical protein